jgi:hypothetical protein
LEAVEDCRWGDAEQFGHLAGGEEVFAHSSPSRESWLVAVALGGFLGVDLLEGAGRVEWLPAGEAVTLTLVGLHERFGAVAHPGVLEAAGELGKTLEFVLFAPSDPRLIRDIRDIAVFMRVWGLFAMRDQGSGVTDS